MANFYPTLSGSLPVLATLLFLASHVSPQINSRTSLTIDNVIDPESSSVSSSSGLFFEAEENGAGPFNGGHRTAQTGGTTMAFVFDVTGSMFDDLQQVIEGAERILDSNLKRRDTPLKNFALVPFHDPEIQEITITEDPDYFQQKLKDLYVQGGGDCPEKSITAIYHALNISLPGSFIYVFTDARSNDYELTNEVLKLIQEKESQVVFVMTGDCGNQSHPGFQAYEQIAATSSGQVFMLNKSDVDLVLRFVEISLQSRKVNLLSTDYEHGATQVHQVPIDTRINQITISVSGDSRNVTFRDPRGRDIPLINSQRYNGGQQYLEELLTLENVYVVGMVEPSPGTYELITNSREEHTVRVTAISLLDFAFGFARNPTSDLNNTFHRPIRGVPSNLMIEALHLNPPGILEKVEFLNLRGETIFETRLTQSTENPDLYIAPRTIPPDSYFHIRVSGIDSMNFRFQRLSKAAISPLIPDPPTTFMPRRTPGYYGMDAILTCDVESMIPFTVRWMRRGTPLDGPIEFSETGSATWTIKNSDSRIEGVYSCIAENEEGSARSETYLDITEPPPVIARPYNTSVLPGSDGVMSCFISSTVEYNITWDKPNTLVSLQGHNRVSLMNNGSLVIQDVHPGDAGSYRCRAWNEGGVTEEHVYLYVQERPQINAYQGNVTFTSSQNITLRCSANGYPHPELRWLKDGQELPIVPGTRRGEIIHQIFNASREDQGIYTCLASNTAGSDLLNVYVSYHEPPRIQMTQYRYLTPPSQKATLSCPTSGVPPPEITWFKGDRDLTRVTYTRIWPNGDLDIMGVQDSDSGSYTCYATNEAGVVSETVHLEVGSSPIILQPPIDLGVNYGMNVSVTCIAMGHPPPAVTWRKVGQSHLDINPRITMTEDGNLFIRDMQVEDSGTYVCVAHNEHGSTEASAQLRITNLIQPQISATSQEEVVVVEDDVVVRCNVISGNPPPTVTWFHSSERLYPEYSPRLELFPDGSLGIRGAVMSDAGNYTCVAENAIGNDTKITRIRVHNPPSISGTETSYTVIHHESVTLLCPAAGHPPPLIEWIKNGQTIPNLGLHQSALTLSYVTEQDAGTYICRVSNLAGFSEIEITLFILVPPAHEGVETTGVVNVTQGDSVTLPCNVRGTPPPQISWFKDNLPLPEAGRNFYVNTDGGLVIQQMSVAEEGQYRCVASNIAGNVSKDVRITILVPPSIEPGNTEYAVVAGGSIILSCEAYGIPMPEVVWQKDGAQLSIATRNVRILDLGSLQIDVTSEEHTGTYTCLVTNEAGSTNRLITLSVIVPPRIFDGQTQYTVVQGQAIILHCPATGTPPPTITWSKEGIAIPLNDPHYDVDEIAGTLTMFGVLPTDFGTYKCVVRNDGGSVYKDITLSVHVAPVIEEAVEETFSITIGQTVSLPCEVTGTPPPIVTWYKSGNPISVTSSMVITQDSLDIYSTRPFDTGIYQCVASNVAGNVTRNFRLIVMIPPSIQDGPATRTTEVGAHIELECRADGIPLPDITWYKDGEPLGTYNDPRLRKTAFGTLQIVNVDQEDSGEYACYVSNDAGKASKFVTLTVNLAPILLDSPDSYTSLIRNPVTLQCLAAGFPPPDVTWLKNGAPLNQEDVRYYITPSNSLLIASTMREDSGIYTCNVSNTAGSQYKHMELTVYLPPTSINSGDTSYDVTLNNPVSLPCEVQSYPPPTITWLKDGRVIPYTNSHYRIQPSSLDIPMAVVRDSGVYTCIATNIVGNISRNYQINVQVPPYISPGPDTITAYLGQNVTLPCDSIGVPTPMTMWDKSGLQLNYDNPRFHKLDEGSLIISDVRELDAAAYYCLVVNQAGADTRRITLTVKDAPRIINELPEVMEQIMNTEVRIPCQATGTPRPQVSWFKDGRPIEQLRGYTVLGDNTLLISSLQPYDNGRYECRAQSESGFDSIDVFIDTQVRPHIAGENTPDDPVVVFTEEDQTVILECNVTDSHPPAEVTWYQNGQAILARADIGIHFETGDTSLRLPYLRPEDAGHYHCEATNGQGSSQRHFSVEVHVGPVIRNRRQEQVTVQVGHSVTIHCEASGVPDARILWMFGDIAISSQNSRYHIASNGSLHLREVQVIDSGVFTCIAKNSAGNDTRVVNINVIVPPSINDGTSDIVRTLSSSVILPCESAGVPFPEITWYKNGAPLNLSNPNLEKLFSGSLRIRSVEEEDSGVYRCVAVNQAGHDYKMLTLWIHTPPSLQPDASRNVSTGVDEKVIIPCNISGSPKPQYRWLKNNRELLMNYGKMELLEDGSLMIRDVESIDRGSYTCEATNAVGVLSRDIRLEVSVAPKITGSKTPVEYPVGQYDSIELQCMVTDAFPPPIIKWYKGDETLTGQEEAVTIKDQGITLEIGSVNIANAGEYYCTATNDAGMASMNWTIDVQVTPSILNGQDEYLTTVQNIDITLLCEAEGNPTPTITWERDNKPLELRDSHYLIGEDGSLRITAPQHTDSGGYVCVASNNIGYAIKNFHLVVKIPPKTSTQQEVVTIGLRQSVTLRCQAAGFPAPTISWRKDNLPIPLSTRAFSISSNGGSLTINSTREGDSGIYSCIASNEVGEQSLDILLKVQEPPIILGELEVNRMQHVQLVEGDDIELPCPTTGYPKPRVAWFRDNRILSPPEYKIKDDGTLVIPGAMPFDAGVYTCSAVNEAGNSSISINVTVMVPPLLVDAYRPVDIIVILNNPARLYCEIDISIPMASIVWQKDGISLREDSNIRISRDGQILEINQVQVNNEGRYTCIATNNAGNATKFFGLTVHVPPIFPDGNPVNPMMMSINEDDSTQLGCHASGYPPPTIRWYKDGRLVTHNEPGVAVSNSGEVLRINRVNRIHAGQFTCVASSIVGNISKSYVLNVRVRPEIEGAEFPHNVSVVNNMGIELRCPTVAIPVPEIVWYKDGHRLHPFQSGVLISPDGTTLRIPNAQLHDEGVYQCVATNVAGEEMKLFNLQIDVPPVIVSREPNQIAVIAGGSTTIDCESYGVPKPTVTWTKNNAFISPASIRYDIDPAGLLHIATVTVADEGVFECFVSNSAGNVTRRIDLQVQVQPTITPGRGRVTTQIGQSVRLFCDATGVPTPEILWQKDGQRVSPMEGFLIISDGMLQINDAQPSDAGRYDCIAKNGAGADVFKVILEVHEPPQIAETTKTYEIRVDASVELECRVGGIPKPNIRWLFNGRELGAQSLKLANGNLKIPVVRAEDSGAYTCLAQNDAGFAQAERILVVLDVPRLPRPPREQSEMTISVNRRAVLTCPADGYPPPEVTWRKDGILVEPAGRITMTENHELIIDRVQESDSGTYTCVATNSIGSNRLNFYLTVQVAPTFTHFPNDVELAAGNRLELICEAIGVPMPDIAWLVNGTEMIPNPPTFDGRSVLAIGNVQKSDSGTYMCRAENILGVRTAITAVRVRVPPRIHRIPSDTTLTLGERAVLNCAVNGDPKPEVTWLKNNRPVALTDTMQQSSDGSLIIAPTAISDAGFYKCQALNLYGLDEVSYHLEIQSRPMFVVEPQNTTVSHGENVLLDCIAQGEPEPSMRWQKEGFRVLPVGRVAILPNNTLKIVAAQLTDSGAYMCLAENQMGRAVMTIHLTVMVHGGWSEWTEWGQCSKTCGRGMRIRTRRCDSPSPAHNGLQCTGPEVEQNSCHMDSCPIHGRWGEWQPFEECSVSCGFGVRVRRRFCDNPPVQYRGRDCEGEGVQQDECFAGECPVDGGWGPWSSWQLCDRTCGNGNTIRERICNNPEPRYGGRDCSGLSRETRACNVRPCPVDGVWGSWSIWSTCTVSCGGGQQTRTRTCTGPLHGGQPCEGRSEQTIRCNAEQCPVHGNWSDWDVWGICSAMCGGGIRQRFRSCTKPAPSPTGRPCVGDSIDTEPCNQQPCQVDGKWTPWSPWSECSETCGESSRRKTRECTNPAPAHGGRPCIGAAELIQACHTPPCIVGPRTAVAMVTGSINGQTLNGQLFANISVDNAGYTMVSASMDNVPKDIGNVMRMLISLISPVYWTSAYERDNTANGFSVTEGNFERQTQVRFWSGEELTMGMHSLGVDENGVLQLTILLTGDTPEIFPEDQVITRNYREDYIQTGPGEIYGKSSRHVTIDGTALLYAWNHTILYDDAGSQMPYLVQTLNTEGATVEYNPVDGSLTYTIRVYFTRGEPRNRCPSGFLLDPSGPYCRDINECLQRNTCSHFCQNYYGGHVCACPTGFRLNRFNERTCDDIDECRYNNGNCPSSEECQNTEGSFRCVQHCTRGTRRIPGTTSCGDINECQESPNICSHQCSNTQGSYQCYCNKGYRLRGKNQCEDVNECEEHNPCQINQDCINQQGRYRCITVCQQGFEKARNGSCIDINECRTNRHECAATQTCMNSMGSYACLCPRGFRAEGRRCNDINECANRPCTYQCRNLQGDYECICSPGMMRAPDRKTCIGYEQKVEPPTVLDCMNGWRRVAGRCVDVNECQLAHPCRYRCVNTEGSFMCECPPGYRLSADRVSCDDINECVEHNIQCGGNDLCFNRQGNYSCLETSCPQYYERERFTGYCVRSCPATLTRSELQLCESLPGTIQFRTLALLTDTSAGRDLLRLRVVRSDGTYHTNTYFSIENTQVPFNIRTESSGRGVLSTRLNLQEPRDYVIKVRAQGFSGSHISTHVELDNVFHIHVSVSQFPYSNS
ncbi:hemicentin-1 isoform X1 [Strongylocentrotus purpuratus]|uniref:Hemicentin-1 n=1 Tax=Strongylocentrotus purpuratus TaxID=7668 RepID=A0A7M7PKU4_STRPU|nr:hemicentin-1 isoform X1 [Strongylocentrotus purpuratus]